MATSWITSMSLTMFQDIARHGAGLLPAHDGLWSEVVRNASGSSNSLQVEWSDESFTNYRAPSGVSSSQLASDISEAGIPRDNSGTPAPLRDLFAYTFNIWKDGATSPTQEAKETPMATGITTCVNLNQGDTQALINVLQADGWTGAVRDLSSGMSFCEMISFWTIPDLEGLKATMSPRGWTGLVASVDAVISVKLGNSSSFESVAPPTSADLSIPVEPSSGGSETIGVSPISASPISSLGVVTSINHSFPSDEIAVNVTVHNPSSETQEYKVKLYTLDGRYVDKEPDTHYKNISAGQSHTFQVDSKFKPGFDIADFQQGYRVVIILQNGMVVDDRIIDIQTGQVIETPSGTTDPVSLLFPGIDEVSSAGGGLPPAEEEGFFSEFLDSLKSGAGAGIGFGTVALIGLGIYLVAKK